MATEKRLIDANDVENKIRQIISEVQEMRYRKAENKYAVNYIDEIYKLDNWLGCYAEVLDVVEDASTVDAVPVVRCKDCKSSRKLNDNESLYLVDECLICTNCEATDHGWNPVFPTHFCSYGERRTDNA